MTDSDQSANLENAGQLRGNDRQLPFKPKRHGFVTFWLIFGLVMNCITVLIYICLGHLVEQRLGASSFTIMVIIFMCLFNSVCSIMLLSWRKAGFYGFVISTFVGFVININLRIPFIWCALGLFGFMITYAILQIKKNGISAWANLK